MREGASKEQAIILRDFFLKKYPQLDFMIIVFSSDTESMCPWNLSRIVNFYSRNWHDPARWAELLPSVSSDFNNLLKHKNQHFVSELAELYCQNCGTDHE